MSYIRLSELFVSIQGEGARAGWPCVFIRLAGCNLDCVYCDSARSAKQRGKRVDTAQIIERVHNFGRRLVEVTGGEPLIQPGARDLVNGLAGAGYETLV